MGSLQTSARRAVSAFVAVAAVVLAASTAAAMQMPFERLEPLADTYVAAAGGCVLVADGAGLERRCEASAVRVSMVGARPDTRPEVGPPTATIHRAVGADAARRSDAWERLRWRDAWPAIDAELSARPGGHERAFVLHPGADAGALRFSFAGAVASPHVDALGALRVPTLDGDWVETAPVAWQELAAGRAPVEVAWVVTGSAEATLRLGTFDPTEPVYVDPVIPSGAVFGPTGLEDAAHDVTVAPDGTVYVVGEGFDDPSLRGFSTKDAFVLALGPTGSLLWARWHGGTADYRLPPTCETRDVSNDTCIRWRPQGRGLGGDDSALAVKVHDDRLLVVGHTWSVDFPTAGGGRAAPYVGVEPTTRSRRDAFVMVLDARSGDAVFSTYAGGDGDDLVSGAAFFHNGYLSIFGRSDSRMAWDASIGVPAENGAPAGWWQPFEPVSGEIDRWRAVDAAGFQMPRAAQVVQGFREPDLIWAFGDDGVQPLRWALSMPPTRPTVAAMGVGAQAALVDVLWLGRTARGEPRYAVVGVTTGEVGGFDGAQCDTKVPTSCAGGPCREFGDRGDAFVAVMEGSRCARVTYIGGSATDVPFAAAHARLAADTDWVVVVGRTSSRDFPVRAAAQREAAGPPGLGWDAFYTAVDTATGELRLSSYLGLPPLTQDESATSDDVATGVAISPAREAVIVGMTRTGLGTYTTTTTAATRPVEPGENGQAFVAHMPLDVADLSLSMAVSPETVPRRGTTRATLVVRNVGTVDAEQVKVVVGSTTMRVTPRDARCAVRGTLVECAPAGGRMRDGDAVTFEVDFEAPDAEGTYEAAAYVRSARPDPFEGDNEVRVPVSVGGIDLAVTMTPAGTAAQPHVAHIDEPMEVVVEVRNLGPDAASGSVEITAAALLRAAAPATWLEIARVSGLDCGAAPPVVLPLQCSFDDLVPGTVARVTFTASVVGAPADRLAGQRELRDVLTARARLRDDTLRDANPRNDVAASTLVFRRADLAFVALPTAPKTVGFGQRYVINVAANNLGPGFATGAWVRVTGGRPDGPLPAGCVAEADATVRCAVAADAPPLAPGAQQPWAIAYRAPTRAEAGVAVTDGVFAARALVEVGHSGLEHDERNNAGAVDTNIGTIDLAVVPPAAPTPLRLGSTYRVDWRIENRAAERTGGVVAIFTFQNGGGVELPIARVQGADCAIRTGDTQTEATCEIAGIDAGAGVNVLFDMVPKGRGELVQSVLVAAAAGQPAVSVEPNPTRTTWTVLGPDLTPTLDADTTTSEPVRGRLWSWSATVRNVGEGAMTRARPSFLVRADTTAEPTQFGFGVSDETVPCRLSALAGLGFEVACSPGFPGLQVVGTITPSRSGPMRVSVRAHDEHDESDTNATAEALVQVRGADLEVAVTALERVERDVNFPVTVRVRNVGPADAAAPRLTASWDNATGLAVVGRLPAGCTEAGLGFACDFAVASGDTQTFELVMRPSKYGESQLRFAVAETGDPFAPRVEGAHTLRVGPPDLVVRAVSASPDPPYAAEADVRLSFQVQNTSTESAARNVEVDVRMERLSSEPGCAAPVTVTSVVQGGAVSVCATVDGGGSCEIPSIEPTGVVTVDVLARTVCLGRARAVVRAAYEVGFGVDPDPSDNSDARVIDVTAPRFRIGFDPAAPEGPYDQSLAVQVRVGAANGGALPAGSTVALTMPWRDGTFALHGDGTCADEGAGVYGCTLGAVAAGQTAMIEVVGTSTRGPVTGTLKVEARSAGGTNAESAAVAMRLRGPELGLSVESSPTDAKVDDTLEWTVAVANAGVAAAENAVVQFTWPAGSLRDVLIDGLGACSNTAGGMLCEVPSAAAAAGGSVRARVSATARRAGDVVVTARVQSKYVPDELPSNDVAQLLARVAAPDLAVSLGLVPAATAPGAEVEATLVVTNQGTVAADPTTVSLTLGPSLTLRRASPGCVAAQGVVRCAVGALDPAAQDTFELTLVPTAAGDFGIEATVVSDPDENPANDRATATLRVTGADADGDGIADSVEDAGPGGGDANGDGTPDRAQAHVASIAVPGHGALVFESPAGTTVRRLGLEPLPAPAPAGVAFPMGALGFEVAGAAPGALVPVRITFPAGVPAWAWYKYAGGWTRLDWDGTTGGRPVDARTLELVLRDGGRGDDDGAANGVVRDPGAAGVRIITVDRDIDAPDVAPGDGTCAVAAGGCSLRAALQEVDASTEPALVRFDFAAPVVLRPGTPLPTIRTAVILDGSHVPRSPLGARGVTVDGGEQTPAGPLFVVEAGNAAMVGLGVQNAGGDAIVGRAAGFRFAEGSLGTALLATGARQPWAGLRADDPAAPAHQLAIVDSWFGETSGAVTYGALIAADDVLVEDVVVNLNVLDGRRPQAGLHTGLLLRDARRASLGGLRVNGAQVGVQFEGDCAGSRLWGSYFGLGVDGFCHAFTRDDPGPAETGTGPCLDQNLDAVVLLGANGVTIGGDGPTDRNVFGDNLAALTLEAGSTDNRVFNNWFGLAADGSCQPAAVDGLCRLYTVEGVLVDDAPGNRIGATGAGNVFGAAALVVEGLGSVGNHIEGNWAGFAGDLLTPLRPGFTSRSPVPVQITGGASATEIVDNTIGELWMGGRPDADTTDTAVTGNRIGPASDGASLPTSTTHTLYVNIAAGGLRVLDGAHGTLVADNTLASARDWCARTTVPVRDLVFEGNHVGLSADGRTPLPCALGGLSIAAGATDAVVDGNAFGRCAESASAAFAYACVLLGPDVADAVVADNTFGATVDGRVGDVLDALASPAPAIIVGRSPRTLVRDNVILGASPWGIYDRAAFEGNHASPTDGLVAIGNRIGVDRGGRARGGATEHGMLLVGAHARIGGVAAGEANEIVGSGGAGLSIGNVTGVIARGNVLRDNAGLGIAFSGTTSPTLNDRGDGDSGPNGSQNHPFLSAYVDGAAARVTATLNARPSTRHTVDVYAVAAVDPSGHGEADVWLGSAELTTGADGNGSVSVSLLRPLAAAERLSATATGPDGTSEFGPASRATADGLADLEVALVAVDELQPGVAVGLQLTVVNLGPDRADGVAVELAVPADWAWVGDPSPPSGSCALSAGRAVCSGFGIDNGDVWETTVTVRPPSVGTYTASLSADSLLADPTAANSRLTQSLLVGAVGYLLTARGQGFVSTWPVGAPVAIEAEFFRTGPNRAIDDMTLTLTLPSDATVVGGDLSCTGPGPVWTCDAGTVPATVRQQTWRVDVVFASPAAGLIVPMALASPAPNAEGAARFDLALNLTGGAPADVSLTLAATPADATAGQPIELLATITNPGAAPVADLIVTFDIPAGAAVRSSSSSCAGVEASVTCRGPTVGAASAADAALVITSPPATGTATACVRRAADSPESARCASITIGGRGFDVGVQIAPEAAEAGANTTVELVARIASTTGAPATTLLWTTDGSASATGPGCAAADGGWRCDVPALTAGASAEVALRIEPRAGEVQIWTARVAAAGDSDPANDTATAVVGASPADDCAGLDAIALLGPDATFAADGFSRSAAPVLGGAAWQLDNATGTLAAPPLGIPTGAGALRVAWVQRGVAASGTRTLEASYDGGATWRNLDAGAIDRHVDEALAYEVVELLAPPAGELDLRWRATGSAAGAWDIAATRVVACTGAPAASLTIEADDVAIEAARGEVAAVGFTATNPGTTAVADVVVDVRADVTLLGGAVDGGACAAVPGGSLRCSLRSLPASGEARVEAWATADGDTLGVVEVTIAARATLDDTLPRMASTAVRFGDGAFGSRAALAWQPGLLLVSPELAANAQLVIDRTGPLGVDGGFIDIVAPTGVEATTTDARCEPAAASIRCTLGAETTLDATDTIAVAFVLRGGVAPGDVQASWVSLGDGDAAAAALPLVVEGVGAVTLRFDAEADSPPAVATSRVVLTVAASDGGVGPVVVGVDASGDLALRAATSAGAVCSIVGTTVRCLVEPLASGASTEITLEVSPRDAGTMVLTARVEQGRTTDETGASFAWFAERDCAAYPCAEDACAATTCGARTGCEAVPLVGASCTWGTACGLAGVCTVDGCVGTGAVGCDDGNACTWDVCTEAGACASTPAERGCGTGCTVGGVCVDGACAGAVPRDCDDGDPCTAESCAEPDGCAYAPVDTPECACSAGPRTTVCEADAWVTRDGCGAEVARRRCDDGDPCTENLCDPALSCRFEPLDAPGCRGCVPACDDRECGADPRCGRSCGTCGANEVCAFGLCVDDPCEELGDGGCCEGDVLTRCGGDTLETVDCAEADLGCGWSDAEAAFACGGVDPIPDGVDAACPWVETCDSDSDCDDSDPCTADTCTAGVCAQTPVADCEQPDAGVVDAGDDAGSDTTGEDDPVGTVRGGCGCTSGPGGEPAPAVWLLVVAAALLVRRRRSPV